MKNASRKQKARYLQNLVRDKIQELYPALTKDDIRCSLMSENGADIKLQSAMARKLWPYETECKNREETKMIFNYYKQAERHGSLEPLLIIKRNREKPLAIISLEHFLELIRKSD